MGMLNVEPLLPASLWLTLAVGGLALLAWYGWGRPAAMTRTRWAAILTLMASSLILILLILLNPTWIAPQAPPEGKTHLTVLVDSSGSMAMADAEAGQTRFQAAARLAAECAEQLHDYEVRLLTFAGATSPADANSIAQQRPEGTITDLAAVLNETVLDSRDGQVLMLLSDGIHNGGGGAASVLEPVRLARAMGTPIYTRTFGGDPQVRDVAVEFRVPQEVAYIGQKVAVPLLVRQRGFSGARARLKLSCAGEEVERRPLELPAQETLEVRLPVVQEKPGIYRYEVSVEPLPGEASRVNNNATLLLRVVDKPIRVLFLEGKPYWDAKFLMRALLADASLEMDCVVRLSEKRLLRRTFRRNAAEPHKPTTQEEWKVLGDFASALADGDMLASYQIVILGCDADVYLTDAVLARLRTWLSQDGGALVCSRGQPAPQVNQRLAQLLPVRWTPVRESRFRIQLTERGRDLRWFPELGREASGASLAQLPTLASATRAEQPKPLAVVLATARGQEAEAESPVVTYQPYGSGRVVVLEGTGMWRWAFLPPQQQQHDEVYRSLWHGLLRWLAASGDLLPGQKILLRSDRTCFGTLEPATATLLLRDEGTQKKTPLVQLRGDGLTGSRTITPLSLGDDPGTFRVAFGKLPEGRYQIQVAGSADDDLATRSAFDVRSISEEQLDLKSRPDLMARIAQDSGGAVLEGRSAREMLQQFQQHRERSRTTRIDRLSAWDRWWVLLTAFGLWTSAWMVRRTGGLV